jgi:uncharacterized protein YutE (UPF0331/DUF86 family)
VVSASNLESGMLKALRESYESRGYTFFVAPARELLPAFLKSHPPDAIAIGDNENIAFEVTAAHGPHVVEQLKRLRELFRDQPKWRLEVVFKTPQEKENSHINIAAPPRIEEQLQEAEQLATSGHERAALVLAWAALEAATRALEGEPALRPLTPKSVLEHLQSSLTSSAAVRLEPLIRLRNAIVHGDVGTTVKVSEVQALIDEARSVISEKPSA